MKASVHGFEIAYDDAGSDSTSPGAPALLLIHGFPLDRTLWATQVRGLSDITRVIAPDLRGFGESGMPAGPVTVDDYADDLRGLLDALGVKSAVVGGLSMGGYIALAFYRRHAALVRGLILADTKAGPDSPEGKQGRDDSIALARAEGAGAVGDKMLPKMLTPKTASERPDVANAARAMMARQSVAGVAAALEAMRDRPDSAPTLEEITAPALVMTGAEDTLIPPTEAEAMCGAIRGARLVSIPGAAHLANLDQPDAFNTAVRAFLKSIVQERD
jgi:pimeloyl-ACP methyl ester carboxylesterase